MKRLWLVAAIAGLSVALAWTLTHRPAKKPTYVLASGQLGVTPVVPWPDDIEKAVSRANQLLADSARLIAEDWAHPPEGIEIPLLFVNESPKSDGALCYSPHGVRAVVVDRAVLSKLDSIFAQTQQYSAKQSPEDLLALMLLHEVGHIIGGRGAPFAGGTLQPNVEATLAKSEELVADQFAASTIRRWIRPEAAFGTEDMNRSLTAQMMAACLSTISFNFTTYDAIEHFGSSAVADPTVYRDAGYSHPNVHLRVLLQCHFISPSETTRKALDDYLALRIRQRGEVIYTTPREDQPRGP